MLDDDLQLPELFQLRNEKFAAVHSGRPLAITRYRHAFFDAQYLIRMRLSPPYVTAKAHAHKKQRTNTRDSKSAASVDKRHLTISRHYARLFRVMRHELKGLKMEMRKTPLAAAAAVVCSLAGAIPASAADLAPERRAYPSAPLFTWTGFYAGLNAGYAFGKADTGLPLNLPSLSSSYDGFVGGVQIGYNWQIGAAVFSFEADMQYADVKGTDIIPTTSVATTNTLEWFGTARGRAGYAFDRVLPYVTGGFAFGRNEYDFTDISTGNGAKGTATHTGWTIGGGIEFAARDAWSVKVEYLHVDLGNQNGVRDIPVAGQVATFNLEFDLVRAGLNYRF